LSLDTGVCEQAGGHAAASVVAVGPIIQPAAATHECFAQIPDVGHRAAAGNQAQLGERPGDLRESSAIGSWPPLRDGRGFVIRGDASVTLHGTSKVIHGRTHDPLSQESTDNDSAPIMSRNSPPQQGPDPDPDSRFDRNDHGPRPQASGGRPRQPSRRAHTARPVWAARIQTRNGGRQLHCTVARVGS